MSFSKALYTFFTRASLAETAAEQQRILAEAKAALSAEEYEALVGVLRDVGLLLGGDM